jgi:uncharacterized protein (TIGR00251 family)
MTDVLIAVHVTPRVSRDEVGGWRGGELAVRVTAPPDDGKANAAACKLVAARLGVAKSAVSVSRGATSRHKSLRVEGVTQAQVTAVFGVPEAGEDG